MAQSLARCSMGKQVRAKAGSLWPVSGIYTCDKCHTRHTGRVGVITPRCPTLRGDHRACNCAYFVLSEDDGGQDAGVAHTRC